MWSYNHSDELMHYGVLGMKWGIRRGKAGKAYAKGIKKLKKIEKKAEKKKIKSAKVDYKSSKYFARGWVKDGHIQEGRAKKLKYKSVKLEEKGKKFYKKMEKTFSEVSVKSLNPDDVAYGKKYAARVLS